MTPALLFGRRMAGVLVTSLVASAAVSSSAASAAPVPAAEADAAAGRVRAREAAFAKTMADRDLKAFAQFVSEEAVFLGTRVLRGRQAVAEGWAPYFAGSNASFSWRPATIELIASGTLAISRGPVFDDQGKRTGTFTSTWRLEKDGEWRVVLDSGCPPCACP